MDELSITPPSIVDRDFIKPLFCGPGPSDVWPSVIKAYSNPILSPICDEQFKVTHNIFTTKQLCFFYISYSVTTAKRLARRF